MKNIEDVPQDIDNVFVEGIEIKEEYLNAFLADMKEVIITRLSKEAKEAYDPTPKMRLSKIGTKLRKAWFEHNSPPIERTGKDGLKFIYGDIVEALIVFLLKSTGHTVEDEQKEVTVNGVVGHQDFRLDGYTTDAKSASSYGFKKFAEGTILRGDDPFGYVAQLSSYMEADKNDKGAFLAVNKENGKVVILKLDEMDTVDTPALIDKFRDTIKQPEPPKEKCYPAKPYGKSGNMTLDSNCGYCAFKHKCWADSNGGKGLRGFAYSKGTVYMTEVTNMPRVDEVIDDEI